MEEIVNIIPLYFPSNLKIIWLPSTKDKTKMKFMFSTWLEKRDSVYRQVRAAAVSILYESRKFFTVVEPAS